jgi:AraC-like DNA-binding protein
LEYRELAPPAALRSAVQCVWTLEGTAGELGTDLQPVLPDGRPELILHLGDPFERVHEHGVAERQSHLLFAGQLTRQLVLRPTGHIALIGVRFHPDGAANLLATPQCDLAGLTLPVQDILPALHATLSEVRNETDSPERGAGLLMQRLAPRLAGALPDARVRHVVDAVAAARGQVAVDALARRTGMTRRHLERRFQDVVGISPKRLARITRFQFALSLLDRLDGAERGIRTAAECGYADQAHFIRDFRELAGCPPGEHLLRRCELTGFFTRRFTSAGQD